MTDTPTSPVPRPSRGLDMVRSERSGRLLPDPRRVEGPDRGVRHDGVYHDPWWSDTKSSLLRHTTLSCLPDVDGSRILRQESGSRGGWVGGFPVCGVSGPVPTHEVLGPTPGHGFWALVSTQGV